MEIRKNIFNIFQKVLKQHFVKIEDSACLHSHHSWTKSAWILDRNCEIDIVPSFKIGQKDKCNIQTIFKHEVYTLWKPKNK